MRRHTICLLLVSWLVMSACAADAPPPSPSAAPDAMPTSSATALPLAEATDSPTAPTPSTPSSEASPTEPPTATLPAEPPASATPEPTRTPEVVVNGRTADGAYFLGRLDAPVTIIDYSDFL